MRDEWLVIHEREADWFNLLWIPIENLVWVHTDSNHHQEHLVQSYTDQLHRDPIPLWVEEQA